MLKYTLKRIAGAIPLVIFISILTFALIQLAPYDAVDTITTPEMSPAQIEARKAEFGLDKPVYVQYVMWAKNTITGNFGYSIVNHSDIGKALSERLPATMLLVIPSYIIAIILAIVLGLISGFYKGRWPDRIIDGMTSVIIAMPSFWVGLLLIYFLSLKLQLFPSLGMYTPGQEETILDLAHHMVLPCITLIIGLLPQMVKYVRSSTIGQLSEDYVMVQRTYGATNKEILFKHVLKNALLPLITLIGMSLPMLVTGAFVTESIFSWPGVGPYFLSAINAFDYPVILTILVLSSSLVVIGNLIADILYRLIDTRIKDI